MANLKRRQFLSSGFASVLASSFPSVVSAWAVNDTRTLKFFNIHNNEHIHCVYWRSGYYDPEGIKNLNYFFRDWRNDKLHHIDYNLFDLLHAIQVELGASDSGFKLISGYRSQETNAMLRRRSGGVARKSLHLKGLAADIRPVNVGLNSLRKAAINLKEGGVGYYPSSSFVHVDTGRVRFW